MNSISLKQEVAEHLPWLLEDYGLKIVEEAFDPLSFGNSLVVFESNDMRVRFIRERGQVTVEVASCSDPNTWWDLDHVCEIISGHSTSSGSDLPVVASVLRRTYETLVEYLGPNYVQTKRDLEQRAKKRQQDMMKRLSH